MAERDEQQAVDPPGPRVPDLIEQYRARRNAWMAQADELARLRDEVRGSAEREAMEIVTAARRDVRQIVMDARRELLVLSAQVQATLGEGPTPQEPAQLAAGSPDHVHASDDASLATAAEGWGFAPNASVRSVLEEARAHMTALAEEARTVPFVVPPRVLATPQAPAPAPSLSSESRIPNPESRIPNPESRIPSPESRIPNRESRIPSPESRTVQPGQIAATTHNPPLSPAASSVLLSPPFQRQRAEVRPGGSVSRFVPLFFVAAGVVMLLGTFWMLNGSSTPEADPVAVDASRGQARAPIIPSSAAPAAAPVAVTPDTPPAATEPASVSVLIEARRPAWIRTIVDGRADPGRTLDAGARYEVRGERSVSLRVGDAGAVMVSVNRGEPRPLGGDGQVVSRVYTAEQPVPSIGNEAQPSSTPAVPEAVQPRLAPPAPAPLSAPVQPSAAAPAPTAPAADVFPSLPAPAAVSAVATFPRTAGPQEATPVSGQASSSGLIPRAEGTTLRELSQESVLVTAAEQWLDAYHRQDRASLAALSTEAPVVADERSPQERFPSAIGSVRRSLDSAKVDIVADTALVTGVMIERAETGGLERVSPVSQLWVVREGAWRLWQARLVSEARLNQTFR